MSDNDIAIRVENLSKYYRLGVINNGTLFRDMQSWWAKKHGKEDPHGKIGSHTSNAEGFWALDDLTFDIKKGDRVGIIGKNGAGKSTLLKVLSKITAPTEGSIKINGKISSLLEVGTGFHPELTGRENIYLNGAILGMTRNDVNRKINEIIEFSEIKEHIDTPVKRYSSGMYVRLAFAVAAHLQSDILIADEVLAVGDAAFQKKALGKMNELSTGEGRTVLFVSHNIPFVKNLCNKGLYLEHGRKIVDSDVDSAIFKYFGDSSFDNRCGNFSGIEIPELQAKITNIGCSKNIDPGKDFRVDIEVESKIDTNNVGVQIMLTSSDGRRYLSVNTATTEGLHTKIKKGTNKFSCLFKNMAIPSGEYYLGIGFDEPLVKMYYQNEYLFQVSVKDKLFNPNRLLTNNPAYGYIYPVVNWSINE